MNQKLEVEQGHEADLTPHLLRSLRGFQRGHNILAHQDKFETISISSQ